ncbi:MULTISPECIES: hypothetical protein [unclassified Streptomyces]|uniref:hypothetical protein n=1 Tax=unclassified Streptomyces TaxID=2593676 RepID=UPI0013A6A910|nr:MULTISPECIES: hypothetical protein [unclassified Streptomyces]
MGMKHYFAEFKAVAVALYRSRRAVMAMVQTLCREVATDQPLDALPLRLNGAGSPHPITPALSRLPARGQLLRAAFPATSVEP